jgi:histone deacetylase 1/2
VKTQVTTVDESPLVSPEVRKSIQQKLGIFNWYLRVTDPTFKCRLSQLGSEQAHATEQTAEAVDYVLNYLHNYPNASLVYYASDMKLHAESDASHNAEPEARSRAGGTFYLGARTADFVNAPVDETSVRIDAVCASAAEAEYASLFLNARKACVLRQTLKDLGHPQGATPILVDNKCAQGLANDTVKRRQSKAIDMRFHWIRDRVRQGQFEIIWGPGSENLADFFTKNLAAKQFQQMRLFFVKDINPTPAVLKCLTAVQRGRWKSRAHRAQHVTRTR